MTQEGPAHVLIQIKKHGVTDSNIHQLLNMDANRACGEVGAAINQALWLAQHLDQQIGEEPADQNSTFAPL